MTRGRGPPGDAIAGRLDAAFGETPVRPDLLLYAVAGLFAAAGTVVTVQAAAEVPFLERLLDWFVNVGFALAVLVGTFFLRRSDLPRWTWWSVVAGYLGGVVFVAGLLVWDALPELLAGASLLAAVGGTLVTLGNLGGVFGFIAGVSRARSLHSRQLRRDLETSNELVENAEEALWMFAPDWSEVLYVNGSYEDVVGQSRETLAEDPTAFLEAIHPDDRPRVRAAMERLSAGESVDIEVRGGPDSGYDRWLWAEGHPLYRDGELYAVTGFLRDVTDRKARERRFEAIFNRTYQYTGLMEPDGTFLEVNEAALEFGGLDREDVVGSAIWEVSWFQVSEATRRRVREAVRRAAGGEFVREELEVQGADRRAVIDFSVRPVTDADGEVVLLVPEGRDITERKAYEKQVVTLHETTRRLFGADSPEEAAEIATEAASDVVGLPVNTIWAYDEDQGALVPVASTEAAFEVFGSIPDLEAGGSLAWDVFESGEPQLHGDLSSVSGLYNPETPISSEIILPLGEFGVFIAGSTDPDAFDDRQVSLAKLLATNVEAALAVIGQRRDIEARQSELKRQNERLEEFSSIVSHDLRNPLAIAKGHAELAREAESLEDIQRVEEALDRMEELVDELLALARAGEDIEDMQPLSLDDQARSCWTNVSTTAAELRVADDVTVVADETRLRQLFENLFRNAVEHGAPDGRPEADGDGDGVEVTVGALPDGGGFYVEDDGPGIPPAEREKVFDASYSTTSNGSGFGLSIVQTVAEGHDWSVTVTDGTEGGARFEVRGVDRVRTGRGLDAGGPDPGR